MRLIGYLLMTIALCLGTVAATTAYVPRLVPADVEGLTLNAVAGIATVEDEGVIEHAALMPTYASKAVDALRDTKRGKPRVEIRFAMGTETDVTLDRPSEMGLIVLADKDAMRTYASRLNLESNDGPMLIALGLSPAQITEITDPKPIIKPDKSFTAVEPSNAIAIPEGVAVPLPTQPDLPPLASLSSTDSYALIATLATEPGARLNTLEHFYPELAAARESEIKALQRALDAEFPPKENKKNHETIEDNSDGEGEAEEKPEPKPRFFTTPSNGQLYIGKGADKKTVTDVFVPIAQPRDILTPDLMSALKASGSQRVRVKEFSIGRWQYSWLMGLAVVLLLVGVVLVRTATKKMIARSVEEAEGSTETPEAAMERIRACLDRAIETTNTAELLVPLTEIQRDHLNVIIDGRNLLVGRMGLASYAVFMDEFSQFERQINRAWSAAADEVAHDAFESVRIAHAMAPAVHEHITSR